MEEPRMLLFLSTFAFAQEAPPIVNGEETSEYAAVGALVALANNGSGFDFCSGTLVHEKWVITAAHCVDAFSDIERKGYGNFYFAMGTDIYDASGVDELVEIKDWNHHPDYSRSNLIYDIGILELATEATTEPVPINDDSPNGDWEEVTYVGWGITGDSSWDYYTSGVKRTTNVPVYRYDYYHVHTYDSADGRNICSGDSGGAMLYPGDGMMMLAGVNSFGYNVNGGQPSCEGNGSAAAAVRVDTSLDWLEGYVTLYRTEDFLETGTDDGGSDNPGGPGGGPGGDDTATPDTGVYDTGAAGTGDPARPSNDGKGCSSVPGGGSAAGGMLLLVLGLIRRREG